MEYGNGVRGAPSKEASGPTRLGGKNRGCEEKETRLRRSVISRKYKRKRRTVSNACHHSPSNNKSVEYSNFVSHSSSIVAETTLYIHSSPVSRFLRGIHSQSIPLRSIYCTALS